ncbi:hypothetical protein F2Q70_00002120 [Brassica cretica]|uniref:chorismate mutase n=1 Tax=Brassica cretica TaxID=69181 RepID=A0A8S9IL57_BRACR|nr:hypothetical protein F2Q70_00002120 [Brassica cretica]
MVKGTEKLPAKVGRFQSPNEHPFFPDYLPEPMLPALQYPKQILYKLFLFELCFEVLYYMIRDSVLYLIK